ncbi:hypothetical protein CYY_006145 [Polysphondylium violaceum]|uniref:Transmembrane protein n=1 Tax=Polysphondylium violaceum TaxID=133409 RepID=A0A8J4PRU3_9MYCE|nr:hypothetical protein CYY_006145 [Polysphondylium violaceum]
MAKVLNAFLLTLLINACLVGFINGKIVNPINGEEIKDYSMCCETETPVGETFLRSLQLLNTPLGSGENATSGSASAERVTELYFPHLIFSNGSNPYKFQSELCESNENMTEFTYPEFDLFSTADYEYECVIKNATLFDKFMMNQFILAINASCPDCNCVLKQSTDGYVKGFKVQIIGHPLVDDESVVTHYSILGCDITVETSNEPYKEGDIFTQTVQLVSSSNRMIANVSLLLISLFVMLFF